MSDNMLDILKNFSSVEKKINTATESVNDGSMLDILTRFSLLESNLDAGQKKANQLSAEFKPKTVKVLGAKTDPKNPMGGKMVGGCEESIDKEVAEDVLSKVKKGLADYLKSVADEIKQDDDIKDKKRDDSDLKKKDKKDRDLVSKVKEDPAQNKTVTQTPSEPIQNPTYSAASLAPVKTAPVPTAQMQAGQPAPVTTATVEEGCICEIHGDEGRGFEIRYNNKRLPTKFKKLDHAMAAIDAYKALRTPKIDQNSDYLPEA